MNSSVNILNYTTANPGGSAAMPAVQVNVFYAIFIPTLIIVSTIMNLATIAAFWKLPSLREKPSELFILNRGVTRTFVMGGCWVLKCRLIRMILPTVFSKI